MKKSLEYNFEITFKGHKYHVDICEESVGIASLGLQAIEEYDALKKYLVDEGFIVAIDEKRGILDKLK